jgi:hypothetical protein
MKTRRNHRKTTTGRRRRHVKHRVQTRIHHRKGTVSSGRRHKFFKRGGEPVINSVINSVIDPVIDPTIKILVDGVENTVKTNFGIPSDDKSLKLGVEQNSSKPLKVITATPIVFKIDGKQIDFVIVEPNQNSDQQSVYVYLDDRIYGRVTITTPRGTQNSYDKSIATIIFIALNTKPDYQKYKQKQ